MLKENALQISAATVGGATLWGLFEYYDAGYANKDPKKIAIQAAIGAAAGFVGSIGVIQAVNWSKASGDANWGVIGGSMAAASSIIYCTYKRRTTKQLLKNATLATLVGGGLGTALTFYQKTI